MSKIEWTDKTWNPVTGCNKVSTGCKNCYAMTMSERLQSMGIEKYKDTVKRTAGGNLNFTGKINLIESALNDPLKWKKPYMVFVNSMSDLFHEKVPFEYISRVLNTIAKTPQHTYQILTKRADRMQEYFKSHTTLKHPLKNLWLGVSCENQKTLEERVPCLLKCPASVRFISAEPLLGDLDLYKLNGLLAYGGQYSNGVEWAGEGGINWVIAGGESGHGARAMSVEWVRNIQKQCKEFGVAFFFKQWGKWLPQGQRNAEGNKHTALICGNKKANGNYLDDKKHLEYPTKN